MDPTDFDAERPRLAALAARILDSTADADDVLQEAWLRLSGAADVEDLPAWLTTVVTRLCLDHLRKRRTRSSAEAEAREDAGAHAGRAQSDPEAEAILADQVGGAMQIVLDSLTPAERAAFVLHDVFGYPFEDIAAILGRSGTAVRQLASRARRRLQGAPDADAAAERAEQRRVVHAFLEAAHGGELATLLELLAPDAVMRADLVAERSGTEAIYDGAPAVAARFNGARGAVAVTVDGEAGGAWIQAAKVMVAFAFHLEGGRIREIELIADPDVLATMDIIRTRRGRRDS